MKNKDLNQRWSPDAKLSREKASLMMKKRQHFERIAAGNALAEIEHEAELRYSGRCCS